ncbi:MAG: glycosyltransferase family 4 protein [Gemmatimonadales bacterium]
MFLEEDWEGLRVLRSWLYASPHPGFVRTLMNNTTFMVTSALHALRQAGPLDVLVASSPPFLPHLAGAAISRWRGMPLALEVRDLWPDYLVGMNLLRSDGLPARALFGLERRLLRGARRVIVVTDSFRRRIIRKGVEPERIEVISNGVDERLYFPSDDPPPVPELRRQGDEFLVGYLGNFGAGQDLLQVVEAAATLGPEAGFRFVLAGDGPDRGRVTTRLAELGLSNLSVHPPIPKEQTRAFYNACDVCLVPLAAFPILEETVPSKIFEIMACERPVLGCLAGEAAAIIERSGGGVVTPPGQPLALAQALRGLRAIAPDGRQAMGRRGRDYVTRHYRRDDLAARYLDLLQRTVAEARASGQTPGGT